MTYDLRCERPADAVWGWGWARERRKKILLTLRQSQHSLKVKIHHLCLLNWRLILAGNLSCLFDTSAILLSYFTKMHLGGTSQNSRIRTPPSTSFHHSLTPSQPPTFLFCFWGFFFLSQSEFTPQTAYSHFLETRDTQVQSDVGSPRPPFHYHNFRQINLMYLSQRCTPSAELSGPEMSMSWFYRRLLAPFVLSFIGFSFPFNKKSFAIFIFKGPLTHSACFETPQRLVNTW